MKAQDGSIMTKSGLQHKDGSVRVAGSGQQYKGGSINEVEGGSIRSATSGLQHQDNKFRMIQQCQDEIINIRTTAS